MMVLERKVLMEGDYMRTVLSDLEKENKKNVYTYYSAKKIFFAMTPSKAMLLEKKEDNTRVKAISLISRNPIVISKDTGMLIFPKKK